MTAGGNGTNGGPGGTLTYNPSKLDSSETYKIIFEDSGCRGGNRRTASTSSNAKPGITNNWLKPEGGNFSRPGGSGGYSKDSAGRRRWRSCIIFW